VIGSRRPEARYSPRNNAPIQRLGPVALNGIAYLERSPLGYWLTAMSYRVGAKKPIGLATVELAQFFTRIFYRFVFQSLGFSTYLLSPYCFSHEGQAVHHRWRRLRQGRYPKYLSKRLKRQLHLC